MPRHRAADQPMLAPASPLRPDLAQVIRRRSRRGPVVVHEDPVSRALEIVKLAAAYRPPQQPEHAADQGNAERDEDVETLDDTLQPCCSARLQRLKRNALPTTSSELPAIPSPASQGLTRPTAASGIATAL